MDNIETLKELEKMSKMTNAEVLAELQKLKPKQIKCLICGYDCGDEHHANNFIEVDSNSL